MKTSTAAIALAISASVILSGCSNSGGESTDAASVTAEVTESESPAPVEVPVTTPEVGDCWDQPNMDTWMLNGTATSCSGEHTGQTIWVGELPDTVLENPFTFMEDFKAANAGADGKVDWDEVSDPVKAEYDTQLALLDSSFSECKTELNELIGANSPDGSTMTTIFSTDITGPTQSEWDAGARWTRCNAGAKVPLSDGQAAAELMTLPQFLEGVMRTKQGLQFNYCYQSGGKRDGDVAICGTPEAKGMRLIISTTFPQISDQTYVGRKWGYQRAADFCIDAIKNYWNGNPKARYGAWALYENREGDRVEGFSKSTWGTDKANFACSISQGSYQHPSR